MGEFLRINRNPGVMGGLACLRETHVTVATVVALVSAGRSEQQILRMFPVLTVEDIREALAYAAWAIDELDRLSVAPVAAIAVPRAEAALIPELVGIVSVPQGFVDEHIPDAPAPDAEQPIQHGASEEEVADDLPFEGVEEEIEDMVALDAKERLELYHPSCPDGATVVVGREGLMDRRWRTAVIAWCDIQSIERVHREKAIVITLRNPKSYFASMPFLQRLQGRIKMALNIEHLCLDTASLGVRTTHLYFTANRFWIRHRGDIKIRRKHRRRSHRRKVTVVGDDFANKPLW